MAKRWKKIIIYIDEEDEQALKEFDCVWDVMAKRACSESKSMPQLTCMITCRWERHANGSAV